MPRNYQRKTERGCYSANVLENALDDIKVKGKSKSAVSKEYGISRATLLRYINLDDSNGSKKYLGRKAVFTPSEEKDLAKYILDCSKMFYGLSLIKTRELAFTYAVNLKKEIPKNWLTEKMAGKDWLDGFRRRNANLSFRSPEGTSLGRATAFNRTTVSEYFDNIESIMKKYNFSPDCIYNRRDWQYDSAEGTKGVS